MKRFFDLSIASILFISSCALEDPIDPNMDPYAAIVTKGLSEIPITNQFVLPLEQLQIFVPMRTVRDKLGRFVIVNGTDWSINLVSEDGELLHRTGGSGRGPGEFTAINHVEITDDHLYVLDLTQNRVTQYQIAGNTLELLTTIPIPESAFGGQYRSIHQINGKLWGVLATPGFSRRFYLMELDSLLKPIKQHIEIPAHFPKIHFSQSQITNGEWFTGETTFNYFFFDSLVVYSYDVISQQTSRLVLQDPYQNRLTNSMNHDFIALKYGGIPSHLPSNRKDDLGDNYELIQASKMSQDQNRIAVNLLYYGGEYSILILYDLMSGEKKFIKAPPDFNMSYLWNNTITGVVVVPNKPNQVVVLEIEE